MMTVVFLIGVFIGTTLGACFMGLLLTTIREYPEVTERGFELAAESLGLDSDGRVLTNRSEQ